MITNSLVPRPLYGLFAVLLILGAACSQDPDDDSLEKHLRLTRQNPTAPPAYYNLAVAYTQVGRYDEAQQNYAKALDLDPNYALAHDGLGLLAQRRGALDEAAAHFQKALDLDSTLAATSNNLGNIHYQEGALEKAVVAYQAAVRQAPGDIAFYINLARALRDLREFDQAVAVLLRAVDRDPFSREVHAALGHLYAEDLRVEDAVAAYGEALRIAPSADLHIRLGDVYT
ncbi:MAG: tetratricopeptide repeat protein, partial [Gemmatimonadetes bacterium]|nr:tetratricopeptide repeat protein [Gemmatimonadota bacterium]